MSGGKTEALVVDDGRGRRDSLADLLAASGVAVRTVVGAAAAREALDRENVHLLVVDANLPDGDGVGLIGELAPRSHDAILTSWRPTIELAVGALRAGVRHFVERPVDSRRLCPLIDRIVAGISDDGPVLGSDLGAGMELVVGRTPAFLDAYAMIRRVAPTAASVVVTGESGTGKELAARAIHAGSGRQGPLVILNCGALSPALVESELFGHTRGAFTGAFHPHRGHFERAAGGTLVLDEVTEMPLELQVKLLRVLESGEVLPLGAEEPRAVDVRIVATSNRDLAESVPDHLRADLYYRLATVTIRLPPLRERRADVAELATSFLDRLNARAGRNKRFTPRALRRLEGYAWPGNVRELHNVVRRVFITAGPEIDLPDLHFDPPTRYVGMTIDEAQRRHILETLAHVDGDKPRAANLLGISLKTLYNRLHLYARTVPGAVPSAWVRTT